MNENMGFLVLCHFICAAAVVAARVFIDPTIKLVPIYKLGSHKLIVRTTPQRKIFDEELLILPKNQFQIWISGFIWLIFFLSFGSFSEYKIIAINYESLARLLFFCYRSQHITKMININGSWMRYFFFWSSVIFRVSPHLNHLVAEVQISLIAFKYTYLWKPFRNHSKKPMIRFNH